jgi:hypothetical protein
MSIYYIITNEAEKHKGYQYKDGLNVLEDVGFSFTTGEFIDRLFYNNSACYLRIVELPDDENLKINNSNKIFKANMLILKEKFNLKNLNIDDVENLLKMDKNLSRLFIKNSCILGNIQILEWLKNSCYEFKYNFSEIYSASAYGHVQVLEWFKNSGYEFKYNETTITWASEKGQIEVLEWFKNSGYKFKYDTNAIDYASEYGHIQVLEWFKNYNKASISTNGLFEFLEWFINYGINELFI